MTDRDTARDGEQEVNWGAMVAMGLIFAALVFGLFYLWLGWPGDDDGTPGAYCTEQCVPAPCQSCGGDVNVSGTIDLNVDVSGTIVVQHTGTVVVSHTGTVAVTVVTQPPAVTTTTKGGGGTTTSSTSTTTTVAPPTTTTTTVPPTTTTVVNHNPSISVNPEFAEQWAESNGEACFTFTATVSDPDGDPLTVSWSTGANGLTAHVCRPVGNAWQISATVSDGRGGTASDGSTFNVLDRPGG